MPSLFASANILPAIIQEIVQTDTRAATDKNDLGRLFYAIKTIGNPAESPTRSFPRNTRERPLKAALFTLALVRLTASSPSPAQVPLTGTVSPRGWRMDNTHQPKADPVLPAIPDSFLGQRAKRHVVFPPARPPLAEPADDGVLMTRLFDFSCLHHGDDLSLAQILRQIGATLRHPVTMLAAESLNIHSWRSGRGCPSAADVHHLNAITATADSVISSLLQLLPGALPLSVHQNLVGPVLEAIANELEQCGNSRETYLDITQQTLFLAKTALDNANFRDRLPLYQPPKRGDSLLPRELGFKDGGPYIRMRAGGAWRENRLYETNGVYSIRDDTYGARMATVRYNRPAQAWEPVRPARFRPSRKQRGFIATHKLVYQPDSAYLELKNANPRFYHQATIYRVQPPRSASLPAAGQYAVEIQGDLVPVVPVVIPRQGLKYELMDTGRGRLENYQVEWDGRQWGFAARTSPHAAKSLVRQISEPMYAPSVSARDLSSPDSRGLQWNRRNESFLRINHKYVRVLPYKNQPGHFFIKSPQRNINLRFRNNKFHPQTVRERLLLIKTEGLSGRGRLRPRQPADIIRQVFSMDREQAERYLGQYSFESDGLYNEMEFALQLEQYEQVPAWAERFKHPQATAGLDAPIEEESSPGAGPSAGADGVIERLSPARNGHDGIIHVEHLDVGEEIGDGAEGIVYEDKTDPTYVLKKIKQSQFTSSFDPSSDDSNSFGSTSFIPLEGRLGMAKAQAELFCRYYGSDGAKVYLYDSDVYIRMLKIPGAPLVEIAPGTLPDDAIERFATMVGNLNDLGIWHADLHEDNVFYDRGSQAFYPIDFSNYRAAFFHMDARGKNVLNQENERNWQNIINIIKKKQRHAPV